MKLSDSQPGSMLCWNQTSRGGDDGWLLRRSRDALEWLPLGMGTHGLSFGRNHKSIDQLWCPMTTIRAAETLARESRANLRRCMRGPPLGSQSQLYSSLLVRPIDVRDLSLVAQSFEALKARTSKIGSGLTLALDTKACFSFQSRAW